MKSTAEISTKNMSTLHAWKRHYGLKSIDALIDKWIDEVRCHKQREMYSRLPMPSSFKKDKPLENVRIRKDYRENRFVQ